MKQLETQFESDVVNLGTFRKEKIIHLKKCNRVLVKLLDYLSDNDLDNEIVSEEEYAMIADCHIFIEQLRTTHPFYIQTES